MTRPRGQIRLALEAAYASCGPTTWRHAAEFACVGYEAARRTSENMARAGALVRVGTVPDAARLSGVRLGVYALAPGQAEQAGAAAAELVAAVRSWAEFK